MKFQIITFIIVVVSFGIFAKAQQINRDKIIEEIEKNGCVGT